VRSSGKTPTVKASKARIVAFGMITLTYMSFTVSGGGGQAGSRIENPEVVTIMQESGRNTA